MATSPEIDIPAALLAELRAGRLNQGLYQIALDFWEAKGGADDVEPAAPPKSAGPPPATDNPHLADANWIKKNIPVSDLARLLDIEMNERHIRCPQDRSHWANPYVKTNGVKCFRCANKPYWSNIGLVMEVTGLAFAPAVEWLDKRIPNIPRCKPRNRQGQRKWEGMKPLRKPNLVMPSIEMLHKSSWWPLLDCVAKRVAEVLVRTIPADTMTLTTTQEKIAAAAGTQRKYMGKVWMMLEAIGMVERQRVATTRECRRGFTTDLQIRLTWNSQAFQSGLNPAVSYPCPSQTVSSVEGLQ